MRDYLFTGFGADPMVDLFVRFALGTFFFISGYHKLFNKERHATVFQTMLADHVPIPWLNCWFVPSVEFFGGGALIIGFLAPLAASGLLVVCGVATCVDGLKRIQGWKPIDRADFLDDVLYLPEVLYMLLLVQIIFEGAGPLSVDKWILFWLWA